MPQKRVAAFLAGASLILLAFFHSSAARCDTMVDPRPRDYVVGQGETLGKILFRLSHDGKKIWGPRGWVAETWKLNPNVVKNKGDLIYPGTRILLPERLLAKNEEKSRSIASESAPVASTAPQEPTKQPEEVRNNGSLTFAPTFNYFRIFSTDTATGGSANVLSTLSAGMDFKWNQEWSDSTQTFFAAGIESTHIQTNSATAPVNGGNNTFSHADFGLEESLSSRLRVSASIGAAQELTLAAASPAIVEVDENFYPKLSAGLSYDIAQGDRSAIRLNTAGFVLFPVATQTYDVKLGTGYDLGLSIHQNLSPAWGMMGAAGYLDQTQNTSFTRQSFTEIYFSFGLSYRY